MISANPSMCRSKSPYRSAISVLAVLATVGLVLVACDSNGSSMEEDEDPEGIVLQSRRVGAGGGAGSSASFTATTAHGQAVVGVSQSASFQQRSGYVPSAVRP